MSFQIAKLMNVCSNFKYATLILLSLFSSLSLADEEDNTRTDTSKAAQKIQAKIHPMVQVPISYNYNQSNIPNQSYTQAQFQITPVIPVYNDEKYSFILNPLFTDNINSQNQQITNQATPLQIASYFEVKSGSLIYGAGPFIQLPTSNLNSGSQQTGLGLSYALYYSPKNWTFGMSAYNAFGIAGSNISGTANIYYFNPSISYTTDSAYTYSFQSWINGNPSFGQSYNSNQLIFSVGKTFKLFEHNIQLAAGPTYMITPNNYSPQGLGGYFSLTFAFREK